MTDDEFRTMAEGMAQGTVRDAVRHYVAQMAWYALLIGAGIVAVLIVAARGW